VAHPRHAQVRARYRERCAYCGVAEDHTGGELTVDHYVPLNAGGGNVDENLVYCCFRCDLFKGEFAATEADRLAGRYVLYPLRDRTDEHFRLDTATGRLQPLTETGRFHIALLHLNRPALVLYRLRQHHEALLTARVELIRAENQELRAIIRAQETYIERLKQLLEHPE
jgi:hypothetical protein